MTIAKCNRGVDEMKTKVLFVAPYRGLRELALTLTREQSNLEIIVKEADLSAAIPLIKYYEHQGIDFIISRGGTAKLIKQYFEIPVIEIKVSGYDIIRALTLIKDYKMKVQMIGFPNICKGVISIARLLNIDIAYTIIHHEYEVEHAVQEAQNDGAQILLGDTVTVKTAQEYGLQGMMITSGKESVLEAFEQVLEMANMMEYMKNRNSVYQTLITKYRDGIAIFEETGDLIYCNPSFSRTFGKNANDLGQMILDQSPEITNMIQTLVNLKEEMHVPNEVITINESTTMINGGRFHSREKVYLYVCIHNDRLDEELESGLQIYRNHLLPTSFVQIVTSSRLMTDVLDHAKKLANIKKHIVIMGEQGTGKRFISNSIHSASAMKDGDFLEIKITKTIDIGVSKVIDSINHLDKGTIYFKGLEYLPLDEQQKIVKLTHENNNRRFIFACDVSPSVLIEDNILFKSFHQELDSDVISLPPLRHRLEDLDELIRLFIAAYNTKYGKQIVGIRQDVLNDLYENDWHGNVTELKKTIKALVRTADGDYIEKADMELVKIRRIEEKSLLYPIDLSKTLDEIEKDIISFVLEEENMNQTQASKRLGINRTTLWRKLKS